MLRDLRNGTDQTRAVLAGLRAARADVLVLAGIDYDHDLVALRALRDALSSDYAHVFSARPNTGTDTGLDLDGDGRTGGPGDAQGWGRFTGQGGMAVLSRHPLTLRRDLSGLLWRDTPGSLLVDHAGRTGAAATGAGVQRLSTTVHWDVEVTPPTGPPLRLLIFHATPPVFDGPEDRNGRRNHDEVALWRHYMDGALGPAPAVPLVVVGAANLPPQGGDGRNQAIRDLLGDPRLRDPPGLAGQPTVDWADPGPGALRVDYILPSAGLAVTASGVAPADPVASRHRLIWVDLRTE